MQKKPTKTRKIFVKESNSTHGKGTYCYEKFDFKNYSTRGIIICKIPGHGSFKKTPSEHINKKAGCPKCSHIKRYENTFKSKCKKEGVDYWRALKRRREGMSEEKIFNKGYVRDLKETTQIKVNGVTYPNLSKAHKELNPLASIRTIRRWLSNDLTPEKAFVKVPNPGYSEGIIYLITNKTTLKKYVGLTIETLEDRWDGHVDAAIKGENKNKLSLQSAIRKYGRDDFFLEKIDNGKTLEDLEGKEIYWIAKKNTLAPNGFNLNKGGSGGGSNKKPVTIKGKTFPSRKEAIDFLSKEKNITKEAAKWRIRHNKINVKSPSKPGKGFCKRKSYKAWSRIKNNYTNPNAKKGYIEGIKLCPRWHDYQKFVEDVGEPPNKYYVFARIDKNKDYEPDNCKWMKQSVAAKLAAIYQRQKAKK